MQNEAALDATFATIVGVFAFLSSVIIGAICEVSRCQAIRLKLYAYRHTRLMQDRFQAVLCMPAGALSTSIRFSCMWEDLKAWSAGKS